MLIKTTGFVLWSLVVSTIAYAHSSGPRPGHTGGFDEKTCLNCHVGNDLDAGRRAGGVFYVAGIPQRYEPGREYSLRVVIGHPDQSRWGFQLSSRFAHSGVQAGSFVASDEMTQVKKTATLEYLEHTEEGTREANVDGPVEFEVRWVAPVSSHAPVVFNAAGNAADDSGAPEGDFIYTAGGFTQPALDLAEVSGSSLLPVEPPVRRITTAPVLYHMAAPVDLDRGQMEFQIQHRFLGALKSGALGDLLGVDRGANINLGLSYALTDSLSAGVARARFDKIVTLNGTWEIQTSETSFWNMSLTGGVEGQDNFQAQYSPYLQLPTTIDYKRFRFLVSPIAVFNSREESELEFLPDPINPESNHTFSLGLGVDAMLTRNLSLVGEFVPRLAGFGGFGETNPAISGAVKIRTWGHVFTVGVSNSRTLTPARYAVNSNDDFSLGFNIYRRIN